MFISSMWDVKEPTHYSKRVGCEVSGCCGCPLCCYFWVGASHRDNLMHLSPLDRYVHEKWLWSVGHRTFALDSTFVILAHKKNTSAAQFKIVESFQRWRTVQCKEQRIEIKEIFLRAKRCLTINWDSALFFLCKP